MVGYLDVGFDVVEKALRQQQHPSVIYARARVRLCVRCIAYGVAAAAASNRNPQQMPVSAQ